MASDEIGRDHDEAAAAGGGAAHAPVMLEEAVEALNLRAGGVYIDATFGAGGYSRAMLDSADCTVLAIDRDPSVGPTAEALREAYGNRFVFTPARFSSLDQAAMAAGFASVDGVVMDVGVSSMQLDTPERGFSFRANAPLDMRMGADGPTAADALAILSETELADVFYHYGEERRSRRVAKAVVEARALAPIATTLELAELVENAIGRGDGRIHPATRVFQALRILVNDELKELANGLTAAERILSPGGRLAVVSFHSLEDRVVKSFLRRRAGMEAGGSRHAPPVAEPSASRFSLVFNGARTPDPSEIMANPRSRSAKLRAAIRTDAPVMADAETQTPRPAARLLVGVQS